MPFITYKKKDKYKYNDYNQVKKWSIEKRIKNTNDINPDIICKLALEGVEEWGHPDPYLDFNKDEQLCYNGKYFTVYKKDKKYKYNDYDQIRRWTIEKRNKHMNENMDDIDPEVLCKVLTKEKYKFDAYSKQIKHIIQNNINETNIENLKTWLITDDINLIPDYLQKYKDIILCWQKYEPFYIKKLRQRLYNSFIGEPDNAIYRA